MWVLGKLVQFVIGSWTTEQILVLKEGEFNYIEIIWWALSEF